MRFEDIQAGSELPASELPLTATRIVAGAIASRDFMPAHHDHHYATSQGAPAVFMNILTTNGHISRFVTDWAGPEAMVKRIAIRLGAPAIPGHVLRFTGKVESATQSGDEGVVELEIKATTDLGDHATGKVTVTLPLGR